MLTISAARRQPLSRLTPCAAILYRAHTITALLAIAGSLAACGLFGSPHQRGARALEQGDYEAALGAFGEAIESGELVAEAYANRGIANEALDHYEAAIDDYTKALELFGPKSRRAPEILNNRGVSYLKMRKFDEATDDFDAALDARPNYPEALANRGRVFLDIDDYDAAIKDLDRAIKLKPRLAEALGNRALAHESQGDDERAIADYNRAIELSHDAQAYFNRGMLRYTLGCFNLAYQDFAEVVDRVDDSEYLWYMAKEQKIFLEGRPKDRDTCMGTESGADRAAGKTGGDASSDGDPTTPAAGDATQTP